MVVYPTNKDSLLGDKLTKNEEIGEGVWVGRKANIVDYIPQWREIGFKWIGGCCRVTPNEIASIKNEWLKYAENSSLPSSYKK